MSKLMLIAIALVVVGNVLLVWSRLTESARQARFLEAALDWAWMAIDSAQKATETWLSLAGEAENVAAVREQAAKVFRRYSTCDYRSMASWLRSLNTDILFIENPDADQAAVDAKQRAMDLNAAALFACQAVDSIVTSQDCSRRAPAVAISCVTAKEEALAQ